MPDHSIHCPQCKSALKFPSGRPRPAKCKCPKCGAEFRMPQHASTDQVQTSAPAHAPKPAQTSSEPANASSPAEMSSRPAPRRRPAQTVVGNLPWILAGVAAVAAFFCVSVGVGGVVTFSLL